VSGDGGVAVVSTGVELGSEGQAVAEWIAFDAMRLVASEKWWGSLRRSSWITQMCWSATKSPPQSIEAIPPHHCIILSRSSQNSRAHGRGERRCPRHGRAALQSRPDSIGAFVEDRLRGSPEAVGGHFILFVAKSAQGGVERILREGRDPRAQGTINSDSPVIARRFLIDCPARRMRCAFIRRSRKAEPERMLVFLPGITLSV
jgi:hypothetical protein